MKKVFAELEFYAHSDKSSNWETFEEFLKDEDIYLSPEDEKKFYKLCYILYEIGANTTVYDDGTYEITSIECGGKTYLPQN